MPGKKFPALLYNMVNTGYKDCEGGAVGWAPDGDRFYILKEERVATHLVPQ